METAPPPPRPGRLRRRKPAPVVPAERWQRAAGWLIDVIPFVLTGVAAVLWIDGPDVVVAALGELTGRHLGGDLPAISSVMDPRSPDHYLFGSLIWTAVVLLALAVLWVVYRVVATARYGRTLGKWLVGSAVVRVDDPSRRPSLRQAWARFAVPQASSWLPLPGTGLLPYLTLCVHPRRRGMHDKAAGTIVVKAERPHLPHPSAAAPIETDLGERQSVGESS